MDMKIIKWRSLVKHFYPHAEMLPSLFARARKTHIPNLCLFSLAITIFFPSHLSSTQSAQQQRKFSYANEW